MKQLLLPSACLVILFAACKQADTVATAPVASFSLDSAKQDISASNEKFNAGFVKGDSATIVSLYTADAEIYGPNMPKMDRKTMGSGIATMPAAGIKKMTLQTSEVSGGPDIVAETGTYEMSDSSKVIDKGKYIVLWKKEDGKWKLHRDIWNSDNAPMAMAPAKK
ncbi:MAG: nuclear transport factor 2 family protein [Bacteroidota bacterium]